jgi:uncharacterized protein YjdB
VNRAHTAQFSAVGSYSDATTAKLTALAWMSSAPSIASVSTAGLATANVIGTLTITATLGSVKGTAKLTVAR